jgi:hypothetical protein
VIIFMTCISRASTLISAVPVNGRCAYPWLPVGAVQERRWSLSAETVPRPGAAQSRAFCALWRAARPLLHQTGDERAAARPLSGRGADPDLKE